MRDVAGAQGREGDARRRLSLAAAPRLFRQPGGTRKGDVARRGAARRGLARRGAAGQGKARRGGARQAGRGSAWRGQARHGRAGMAKRRAIPDQVKLKVVLRQCGRCSSCQKKLGDLASINFDHRPALVARRWDAEKCDFDPPGNSVEHIEAVHIACHAVRTFGPGGEKRITTRGSDIGEAARTRRLTRKEEEFRRRMLATDDEPAPEPSRSRARKIPSRPFAKRTKLTTKD